jgi:hypothetical protein
MPRSPLTLTEPIIVNGAAARMWPEVDTSAPVVVADITRALAVHNPVVHSSAMMRKPVILALGGYDEARRFVFDYDLWVRWAAAGIRLGRIQLPLPAKRTNPGQSYLHSSHLPYHFAGVSIQIHAIRALGIRPRSLPLIALRFLWGVLPPRARANSRRFGSSFRRTCSDHCWKSL